MVRLRNGPPLLVSKLPESRKTVLTLVAAALESRMSRPFQKFMT